MDWIWRNILSKALGLIPNYKTTVSFLELECHYNSIYLEKLEKKRKKNLDFIKYYENKYGKKEVIS